MAEPYLVYLVWRDHTCAQEVGPEDELPATLLFEGIGWVVDENDLDVKVAAYRRSDGGWADVTAIARSAIERIYRIRWPDPALGLDQLKVAQPAGASRGSGVALTRCRGEMRWKADVGDG